jgi:hypothetical protein
MSSSGRLITTADILDGTIVNADVASSAGVLVSKLAAGGTADRVVGTTDGTAMTLGQVSTAMLMTSAVTVAGTAQGSTGTPNTTATSASPAVMPEMAVSLTMQAGEMLMVHWDGPLFNATQGTNNAVELWLNGVLIARREFQQEVANLFQVIGITYLHLTPPVGTYAAEIKWWCSGGTLNSRGNARTMFCLVIRR